MKYIDAEEITPIMAEYVADVFSRKEHLDNISYGYCMEIADVFRRYAERAKQEQPKKSQKSCNDCPHCVDRKDQFGWHFKGCFGGPYNGKFIAEIDECPLQQEQPSLPDNLDEAAMEIVIKMHPCLKDCTILGDRLTRGQLMALVKAGANWQKNQMMKKTVDGEVGYWNQVGLSILLDKSLEKMGYDENTKVKLIIVKED